MQQETQRWIAFFHIHMCTTRLPVNYADPETLYNNQTIGSILLRHFLGGELTAGLLYTPKECVYLHPTAEGISLLFDHLRMVYTAPLEGEMPTSVRISIPEMVMMFSLRTASSEFYKRKRLISHCCTPIGKVLLKLFTDYKWQSAHLPKRRSTLGGKALRSLFQCLLGMVDVDVKQSSKSVLQVIDDQWLAATARATLYTYLQPQQLTALLDVPIVKKGLSGGEPPTKKICLPNPSTVTGRIIWL
jgi:hypothetical protein